MLLQEVEFEILPAREADFNEWYHPHVPHLLGVPGYESGRRFLRVAGCGPKYVALYELAGPEVLKDALSESLNDRHPSATLDEQRYDALKSDLTHLSLNVFEPVSSSPPYLHANNPVALIRSQHGNPQLWRDLVEHLATSHDVVSVSSFRPATDETVSWLGMLPKTLAVVELSGIAAASNLEFLQDQLTDAPTHDLTSYRQIAWHAPM